MSVVTAGINAIIDQINRIPMVDIPNIGGGSTPSGPGGGGSSTWDTGGTGGRTGGVVRAQGLEAGMFGAAGFGAASAPAQTVNMYFNLGIAADPIQVGRQVEEVLYRYKNSGGQIRISRDDAGVITLGV